MHKDSIKAPAETIRFWSGLLLDIRGPIRPLDAPSASRLYPSSGKGIPLGLPPRNPFWLSPVVEAVLRLIMALMS